MADEAIDQLKLQKAARAHAPYGSCPVREVELQRHGFLAGANWLDRELNEHLREVSECPPDDTLEHWLGVLRGCWEEAYN